MVKFLYIIFIINLTFHYSYSQPVWEQWRATYEKGELVHAICLDDSGNVYVTGKSDDNDYATVKYSNNGVQLWSARYLHTYQGTVAEAFSINADRFGNAYVTGMAPINGMGTVKYTTIKYNQSGEQVWVRIYYGEIYIASNNSYSITTDYNANIFVTGWSVFNPTGNDYLTIKYDSAGNELWVARYANQGQDKAKRVVVDNSGNVYVTGECWSDKTYEDIVTIKYNSSGVQQWAARYNGPGDSLDTPNDLKVDNNGNVYVTGKSWGGYSTTQFDYITIKYNSSGVQQWVERESGTGNWTPDEAKSLAVDNSGNVYITGYYIPGYNQLDCATIKYDSSGIQQWVKIYDYSNSIDFGVSLALDKFNYVYVLASSYEGLDGHYATIKYSPSGEQEWVIRTYSNGENPKSIAVDTSGGVYVAGSGNGDYLTIKYNQLLGIKPVSIEIPLDYFLYQNYPNPFNPKTNIRFDIAITGNVRLVVYDITGKQVAELANREYRAGKYEADFDGTNLSTGIYFYKLETSEFIDVKKMIFVK